MNYNKSNADNAISFFARMLVITIGCLITSIMIFSISSNVWIRALIQLCQLALVIGITYSFFYKIGESDIVLISTGHKVKNIFRGFIISSASCIPTYLFGILLICERFGAVSMNIYNYYKLVNSPFFPFLYTVMPTDMKIMELSNLDFVMALSVLFIIPLIALFSYMIGLSRFSFRELIFYKKIKTEE